MKKNIFIVMGLLISLSSTISAATIRLSPVTVEILSHQKASSISLYNQSNDSADLQIRIFEWTQNDGQDQLIPTDDIAISPPFIKLKPNDSYNLRVVRIKPEPISGEKTYRIILDELPKPIDSRKASQGVNVLLRSSLPVFVV
ncbi:fimbrial biogenesis chaperone, partial [Acinetobacter seifertii]